MRKMIIILCFLFCFGCAHPQPAVHPDDVTEIEEESEELSEFGSIMAEILGFVIVWCKP